MCFPKCLPATNLSIAILRLLLVMAALFSCCHAARAEELCRIDIVDAENGWPVPLVELRTVHNVRFVSDNAGMIAFDLPELMEKETWFFVEGHGYEVPKDGFGMQGVKLTPQRGKTLRVLVNRKFPGKRLGRITGGGLFGESQKLGLHKDWKDQAILGCDSVQNAIYKDKLYWAWGDTNLPAYPLGLFHMVGAQTSVKPLEKLEPPIQLHYDYFASKTGRPLPICKMPGDGPTWFTGLVVIPDKSGKEHLVACYRKVRQDMATYEIGLCEWNPEKSEFKQHRVLWRESDGKEKMPVPPEGHPVRWKDSEGKEWLLFGESFPDLKCEPTFEAWENPDAWKKLKPQDMIPSLESPIPVAVHRAAIAWNDYRKKWVTIFTEIGGRPSPLGEIWYAEAESPLGPWKDAIHVVTHDNYTFYNPQIHTSFVEENSPILIFEGTFTKAFANDPPASPRNDYNQILYRLDLDALPTIEKK